MGIQLSQTDERMCLIASFLIEGQIHRRFPAWRAALSEEFLYIVKEKFDIFYTELDGKLHNITLTARSHLA